MRMDDEMRSAGPTLVSGGRSVGDEGMGCDGREKGGGCSVEFVALAAMVAVVLRAVPRLYVRGD